MAHFTGDTQELARLLGDDIADALRRAAAGPDMDVADLERLERDLATHPQVLREQIGHSTSGRPMHMLRMGSGRRSVLAYGFAHPDEPLGARALAGLAREWAAGNVALQTMDVTWNLIFCADPDIAAWNRRWTHGRHVEDFVYGTVRPEHLAREVDYGFPVDAGIFLQPVGYDGARACWSAGRCVRPHICGARCQRHEIPAGPLPESRALARAIDLSQPDLVVSLHDTHTGGLFSFLRHRPAPGLMEDLSDGIARACHLPRHIGQRIDSGRPWSRRTPDLIREPDLHADQQRFLRRTGADPSLRYHGNVSAAQYLESQDPGAQFLVPESPHLTHGDFGDDTVIDVTRRVRGEMRMTRAGRRYVVLGEIIHPDGHREEALYRMRTQADGPMGTHDRPLSIGMLGVEAVYRRRRALALGDAIWNSLGDDIRAEGAHPWAAERRSISVPATRVNDASLRYFRLSTTYDKSATIAHHADFDWRWSVHTAQRLGSLARFLDDVGAAIPDRARLDDVIDDLLAPLPITLRHATRRTDGALAQLARLVLVLRDGTRR